MKTTNLKLTLAALALAFGSAAFIACGSDDTAQPGPTPHDSGTGSDGTVGMDGGGGMDTGPGMDTGVIDTGSCVSDAATCNSCYTPQQNAQDPYNACSSATANCVPFNNATRVPANVPRL